MQQQLSLLNLEEISSDSNNLELYLGLLKNPNLSWNQQVDVARYFEKEISTENYARFGFKSTVKFLKECEWREDYVIAAKFIWWHKLVWSDRPLHWLTKSEFATCNLVRIFPWLKYSSNVRNWVLDKSKLTGAQSYWRLLKIKHGEYVSIKHINQFIDAEADNTELEVVRERIGKVELDLQRAQEGILSLNGREVRNNEIPLKFHELYCMAQRSDMSSLQMTCFIEIMFFQGYYAACRYLDKFELIA